MQWEEHGRARAIQQDVDQYDDLQEAIETCPVNCIHRYNTWIRLAWDHMTWAEVICYWFIIALMAWAASEKDTMYDAAAFEFKQLHLLYDL